MRADAIALALRARSMWEAADLGTRLVQRYALSVWGSAWPVFLAVSAIAAATLPLGAWAPTLVFGAFRAWMDRTLLFVLARAALGQHTRFAEVRAAWRSVWCSQMLLTFFWRPLSPWRTFTQPVYQLEGLNGAPRRARKRQLLRGQRGPASLLTGVMWLVETAFTFGLLSLIYWFAPPESGEGVLKWLFSGEHNTLTQLLSFGAQVLAFALIEPFYVASGFAMYLNRRVELEAWDIEQDLRRHFAESVSASVEAA